MNVDFFISRAGPDAEWGQWIAETLENAGYSVVLQEWDFRPGQDFIKEMDRAMRNADRTIAVLSRSYDEALFTVPEWTNAIARDPTGQLALLVPVRIEDILPEGILKTRIFIDLVGIEEGDAQNALLEGVNRAVSRKAKSATFPGKVTSRFPGSLPPVWRVPFDRNPVFTGREEELNLLTNKFNSNDPPPLLTAIVGLDGLGKTAIAVQYAYLNRQQYKLVWWIRGERLETAIADLALLADALGVSKGDDSLSIRADAALSWLSTHDKWLLIVDDASDPSVIWKAIPQGGDGHVLVTSNMPSWRRHASVLDLPVLSDAMALELLEKRSGQKQNNASIKLIQALGALPLAVELAGAFLEQSGIEAEEYLERLHRRGGLPIDNKNLRPPDISQSLRAIWKESFQVLQREVPIAIQLLRLSAYFAPDDIPRPALVRGAHCLPASLGATAINSDALADLVARPRRLSLIKTNGDGFSIHRLVQAMIREDLEESERKSWATSALILLNHILPKQVSDFRLWDQVGRLIGHALNAVRYGIDQSVEPIPTLYLLDRGATYLNEIGGEQEEVAARRKEALQLGEKLPVGPPGWLLNNHALWLLENGHNDDGEIMLQRALNTTRRKEGGGSPSVGSIWTNLGSIAHENGNLDKARIYLQRGLAILDQLPNWADERRAIAHGRLGQVLFSQGDRSAAAAHFSAAIRGYDGSLGPGSYEAIMARSNLAQAKGEHPSSAATEYIMTPETIKAEKGKLLSIEPAWIEDAEQALREAYVAKVPGAAVELANLLRKTPGREAEGDAVLLEAVEYRDLEALYWYSRELGTKIGIEAESIIRYSVEAGNLYSYYDLGLVLSSEKTRWPEAEQAFEKALEAGYEEARNDLGILLLEWPGREQEGEATLAEAGRRGQARCWYNLGQHLWLQRGRREEAINPLRLAAHAGYLIAHGTLAYRLEELGLLEDALSAFKTGIEAGDQELAAHLIEFLDRNPGMRYDTTD